MTIEEINIKEHKANKAFKEWISGFDLTNEQQQLLCDYVAGLNLTIADLESELIANQKQ